MALLQLKSLICVLPTIIYQQKKNPKDFSFFKRKKKVEAWIQRLKQRSSWDFPQIFEPNLSINSIQNKQK